MSALFDSLLTQMRLASPLFMLAMLGYALIRWAHWPTSLAKALNHFVFTLALPAMLFRMMSDFSSLPEIDVRLLLAFFGSCLIVFVIGRVIAARFFQLDGVSASIFALGGIFSNNVMLGLPIAKMTLGESAVPAVALVLVFNALILWTLVTISVEWSRQGAVSVRGFTRLFKSVLTNPIILAILSGALCGVGRIPIPTVIDIPLAMIAQAAVPMALIALGLGLAEYKVREGWRISAMICILKLIVQPLVVWMLAYALHLPTLETRVVVLLGSTAVGANVYLMACQFKALEGPAASSLVVSTVLAAITTPFILALMGV